MQSYAMLILNSEGYYMEVPKLKLRTPNGYELELTVEEFLKVAPNLAANLQEFSEMDLQPKSPVQPIDTREVILRVLRRKDISDGQKALFRALMRAGEAGLSQKELADQIGSSVRRLNGVLGALGRRISNTEGANTGIGLVLDVTRVGGSWHYQIKDELREILLEGDFPWLHAQ
jgi:hypothetical protein